MGETDINGLGGKAKSIPAYPARLAADTRSEPRTSPSPPALRGEGPGEGPGVRQRTSRNTQDPARDSVPPSRPQPPPANTELRPIQSAGSGRAVLAILDSRSWECRRRPQNQRILPRPMPNDAPIYVAADSVHSDGNGACHRSRGPVAGDRSRSGVTDSADGLNFVVFSRFAEMVQLLIWPVDDDRLHDTFTLDPRLHRTGHHWHIRVSGLPTSSATAGALTARRPGSGSASIPSSSCSIRSASRSPTAALGPGKEPNLDRRSRHRSPQPVSIAFRSTGKRLSPLIPYEESVIYELHVRGFTQIRRPASTSREPLPDSSRKSRI